MLHTTILKQYTLKRLLIFTFAFSSIKIFQELGRTVEARGSRMDEEV